MNKKRRFQRLGWILLLLLIWELTAHFSGVSPLLLPPVESVAITLVRELFAGTLGLQLLLTVGMILLALVVSYALALAMTLLARRSQALSSLFDTLSPILHPLPGVALLPLLVVWFGTGTASVFAVMLHACLWSLYLSLQEGFAGVPALYAQVGQSLSMSKWRVELEILLPASAPAWLAGLRVAWARAWRALISAEMVFGAIGQLGGVGWYLFRQRAFMNTSGLFAGIACVMIVGYAVETLAFGALDRRVLRKEGGGKHAA